MWKLQEFTLTVFCQKFRESNVFTKELTIQLISRNIFSCEREFLVFPHCVPKSDLQTYEIQYPFLCKLDDKIRSRIPPKTFLFSEYFYHYLFHIFFSANVHTIEIKWPQKKK